MTDHASIVDVRNASGLPGRSPYLDSDTNLWCLDTGTPQKSSTPEIVIFLHSAVGNLETFTYQFAEFVQNGFRVLAYDRRGHGRSPAQITGSTRATPLEDLASLLDVKGIAEPVHLVGAAAGGRLAADFCLSFPERVASLTLVCSLAGIAAELYPHGTEALLPPEFLALPPYLRELGPVYRGDNPQGTADWRALVEGEIPKDIISDPAAWVDKPPASTSAGIGNSPTPGGVAGLVWLAAPGQATTNGVPVHLITGDADPYTTPSAYTRLAQALPRARFDVVTGSGHSPYWEQPDAFNALVLRQTSLANTKGALA